jgi:hypothetical protein
MGSNHGKMALRSTGSDPAAKLDPIDSSTAAEDDPTGGGLLMEGEIV